MLRLPKISGSSIVIEGTKILHTESQHMCLVDTETAKVPALDLYKNSKSENKNLPFFNYEKIEHICQKIEICAS